jgi:hypothetical protein
MTAPRGIYLSALWPIYLQTCPSSSMYMFCSRQFHSSSHPSTYARLMWSKLLTWPAAYSVLEQSIIHLISRHHITLLAVEPLVHTILSHFILPRTCITSEDCVIRKTKFIVHKFEDLLPPRSLFLVREVQLCCLSVNNCVQITLHFCCWVQCSIQT